MCWIARALTDAGRDIIACYCAAQPISIPVAGYDEAQVERGRQIHVQYREDRRIKGASDLIDEVSILRGQDVDYIRTAMKDFRSGDRLGEDAMIV